MLSFANLLHNYSLISAKRVSTTIYINYIVFYACVCVCVCVCEIFELFVFKSSKLTTLYILLGDSKGFTLHHS